MPHKKQKRDKKKNKNNSNKKEEKEIKEVVNLEINNNIEKEINQMNDNNHDDNLDDIKKAFEYFDIAHTGKIHISDLTKALSTFGDIMTEEEMNNIFKSAGIDLNDKEIDYNKFIDSWIGDN